MRGGTRLTLEDAAIIYDTRQPDAGLAKRRMIDSERREESLAWIAMNIRAMNGNEVYVGARIVDFVGCDVFRLLEKDGRATT